MREAEGGCERETRAHGDVAVSHMTVSKGV